jgi:hypothetical protein
MQQRRNRRIVTALALGVGLSLVAAAAGCGSSGPEMATVRGKVTVNGKPLTRGTIAFIPSDPSITGASSPIDGSGDYDLHTIEPGDGARLGDYKVTVSDQDTAKILDYIPKKGQAPKKDALIAEKYGNPGTSGLSAKVVSGSNKFNFDLEKP